MKKKQANIVVEDNTLIALNRAGHKKLKAQGIPHHYVKWYPIVNLGGIYRREDGSEFQVIYHKQEASSDEASS